MPLLQAALPAQPSQPFQPSGLTETVSQYPNISVLLSPCKPSHLHQGTSHTAYCVRHTAWRIQKHTTSDIRQPTCGIQLGSTSWRYICRGRQKKVPRWQQSWKTWKTGDGRRAVQEEGAPRAPYLHCTALHYTTHSTCVTYTTYTTYTNYTTPHTPH